VRVSILPLRAGAEMEAALWEEWRDSRDAVAITADDEVLGADPIPMFNSVRSLLIPRGRFDDEQWDTLAGLSRSR
jgi:hypothetical protein